MTAKVVEQLARARLQTGGRGFTSHQIFHYTHCITTNCVTSFREPSPRRCAGNTAPFEEILQWHQAFGNAVSNLTSPRFELQTSCSKYNALRFDQLSGIKGSIRTKGRPNWIQLLLPLAVVP